jgi:16S rRNA (guanine(966)-N(2))-methyltransferase RsmD
VDRGAPGRARRALTTMKKRDRSPLPAATSAAPRAAPRAAARAGASAAGAPPGRVRIIGGRFRRTPLAVLDAPGLRPTPDRVRVTVFNWLEHLVGDLSAVRALDLFAGTGAMGFEMASRGARQVLLVDSNPRVALALRGVQQRLRAAAVDVVQSDWRAALARLAPASFDVIFLDPPFDGELLGDALAAARRVLAPGGIVYTEGPAPLEAAVLAAWGLEPVRAGRAGVVYFHLLRARPC